jgi:5'-nucleotidase
MQLLTVGKKGNEQAAARAMVDKYNNNPEMKKVIAKAPFDFRNTDELGYWMADALKITAKTEIAVINKGGVRIDELPAGDVTRKTILTIDPFGNQVVTLNLTGHELKAFISNMFGQDEYRIMYPSGIHLKYTVKENGSKLIDLELLNEDGTPLNMDKTYSVATNSYVIVTAVFERKDPGKTLSITTAEGWINWLLEKKTVKNYQEVKRVFIKE